MIPSDDIIFIRDAIQKMPGIEGSTPIPYIDYPSSLIGWLGFILLVALLGWLAWRERKGLNIHQTYRWVILFIVFILTPITASVLKINLPFETSLPIPGLPAETVVPTLVALAALPWMIASGMVSGLSAGVVGVFGGLWLGLWESHSIFTPIEIGILAFLFSALIRQPYRTPFYQIIGHPLAAALLVAVMNGPLVILTTFLFAPGSLALRIDYALTQSWPLIMARAGELIIAGLICEILFLIKLKVWDRPTRVLPSPSEVSLQARYLTWIIPLVVLLILGLTIAGWTWAGNTAREQLGNHLQASAEGASDALPYFLQTGQNLLLRQATADLLDLPVNELQNELLRRIRLVPFFDELSLIGQDYVVKGWMPLLSDHSLTEDEEYGVDLAIKGVMIQTYAYQPSASGEGVVISFIASIIRDQKPVGALLGRAVLQANPFIQTSIQLLQAIQKEGGMGMILDENHQVLYSTTPDSQATSFGSNLPQTAGPFTDVSPEGKRMLMFYQPAEGRTWSVVVGLPAENVNEIALKLAVPQFLLVLVIGLVTVVILLAGLRNIIKDLRSASGTAVLISQGRLDIPLQIKGDDEIGQLGQAFEKMRIRLSDRLDELNSLLQVSQGVASNLRSREGITPILQAAMRSGASCARIVLIPDVSPESATRPIQSYGEGPKNESLAYLDEQLLDLARYQPVISMPLASKSRRLSFAGGENPPASVIALALNYEHDFYGVFWLAFNEQHQFTDEEVRFLNTLAGEAALAAANTHLYAAAEAGRQRLEAVLNSAPEPILVFDDHMNLLLLNPAALQIPELIGSAAPGKPLAQVVQNQDLQKMILRPIKDGNTTGEVTLSNQRIYFASISQVQSDDLLIGRVCILRDITHYKVLDREKSEYVANVSHDLRSPLTLLRGYVTMIQMMGDLNDQQQGFLQKMITSLESMSSVVEKLLDLGRLESGMGLMISRVIPALIIDEVVTALTGDAARKNIEIDTSGVPRHRIEMEVDPALLSQALRNLVENAIKYTPIGGKIHLSLLEQGDSLVFQIRDNGIGIAPLDLPRVFEKFYRSSRREAYAQKGSGLGLAIVKSIAERHYGRVWVESQLGKGSVFFIQLPLRQPKKTNH